MKKSIKISTIFACIMMFIASLILSVSLYVKPTKAAASTSGVFEMEKGASIKLSTNGLRFKAKMDKTHYDWIVGSDDVELWGYIAPVEQFDTVSEYKDLSVKVGGKLDESKIYQEEDGYYYANIVITDLATYSWQDRSFSAIMFIKDSSSGTATYTYADFAKDETGVSNIEAQTRTQYEVINAAMLDAEENYENKVMSSYGSWYGSESHPIIMGTVDEYNAFVDKLEASDEFVEKIAGKQVFIKQAVSGAVSGAATTLQNYATVMEDNGHVVTFYDGHKVISRAFVADGDLLAQPSDPTRDGYEISKWTKGSDRWDFAADTVTEDSVINAHWRVAKGEVKDIGNMKVYGVTRADGGAITSDASVIGQKVYLASGDLGDGAYYPGTTDGNPDPTDENNTADQAYIAYDLDSNSEKFGFNDYFVADFTGKNMPILAFFANDYDNSIFYGDGTKNGVVVSTGLTWPNGTLFTEGAGSEGEGPYCTSVWDGKGLAMWGPHMIYSTAKNATGNTNVLLHANVEDVALGRANLESGKKYRIIIGFQPGDDLSNKAIKLVYNLYDLDTNEIVESFTQNTYNFFADGWANAGQTRDEFCLGSIVAYGYFGTRTVLDKVYNIYEDTTINAIAESLHLPTTYNSTINGDAIVLEAGIMGSPTDGYGGPNANENGYQGYYAVNGDYSFDDYVVFDFTGKNMPEVAFFAKNYDSYMYAENGGKQGVVVASGVMAWDGSGYSNLGSSCTQVCVSGPYMADFNSADAGGGNLMSNFNALLARANLVDGTRYRVIMGFDEDTDFRAITLKYALYNLDTNTLVEEQAQTSWNLFNDIFTISRDLSGSIVLYGKFANVTTSIDKVWGVYENTTISDIAISMGLNKKTVKFVNYDGTVLEEMEVAAGVVPEYTGETPVRYGDAINVSYTFNGWDQEIVAVTDDVTYTATFTATENDEVSTSTSKGVTKTGNTVVLAAGGVGNGANYTQGQQYDGDGGGDSYVDQAYLAFDGNYDFSDYVALDFTGKNMPEIAFFAKNYDNSMYANGTTKQGIVVVTGITTWDGELSSGVNGNGTQINYGFPFMIQDAASGGFTRGAFAESKLGRANLADGTHYRVIMGFEKSGTAAITLNWYLYNLDTATVVEQSSMTTWGFFTGSNAEVNSMTQDDLVGSIVLYGKFGVACTLDKVWGVFEDTTIADVASGLNNSETYTVTFKDEAGNTVQEEVLPYGARPEYKGETLTKADEVLYAYTFAGWDKEIALVKGDVTYTATFATNLKDGFSQNNSEVYNNNEGITLNSSSIGDSAHYSGSNNQSGIIGTVNQSYLAFDGDYSFNDYVVFDFTGKNMPSVAFFANNYNESMYYQNGDKYGLVVLTGLTTWQGVLYTEYNDSKSVYDGKGLLVCGPYMLHNTLISGKNGVLGFQSITSNSGNNSNVALGRANLDDSKQYRVIMGMEAGESATAVKIVYYLYNVTDGVLVEQFSAETYNFFATGFAKDGQTRDEYCKGSIVLYGHFGTPTTLDKVWGVYENTTISAIVEELMSTDSGETETPDPETPTVNSWQEYYGQFDDKFDFYAYSSYSDGTYEIDGEKYYVGKNLATIKQYSLYGGVGMTIYYPQNDFEITDDAETVVKAKKLIDDLAKAGITKTILQDKRILHLSMKETAIVGDGCQFADEAALDEYIYNCLEDYATYPGVYGVQLGDEPKYVCLSAYAAVYNSIKRVNAANGWNLFIQYNLNPLNYTEVVFDNYYPALDGKTWDDGYKKWFGLSVDDEARYEQCIARYEAYINDFLDAMKPDSIMYDDYPLREDANGNLQVLNTYIPCLQIVAKEASEREIAFYNVTQAHENNADGTVHKRAITEAGAKWLNNILIGFGAKQIAYYTYYTRSESDSNGGESYVDGSSFVDYSGNPTDLYYVMKDILSDNQIFASTVLQFDYQGSRYYKGSSASSDDNHVADITTANSFSKLTSFSVDKEYALVTELYDDTAGNYMYMAMNIVDPDAGDYSETMTMTFSGYSYALVYRNGVFEEVTLNGGVLSLTDMAPGDAAYVIPYN